MCYLFLLISFTKIKNKVIKKYRKFLTREFQQEIPESRTHNYKRSTAYILQSYPSAKYKSGRYLWERIYQTRNKRKLLLINMISDLAKTIFHKCNCQVSLGKYNFISATSLCSLTENEILPTFPRCPSIANSMEGEVSHFKGASSTLRFFQVL